MSNYELRMRNKTLAYWKAGARSETNIGEARSERRNERTIISEFGRRIADCGYRKSRSD